MIKALSTPRNRVRTFILLAICGLLAVAAAIVGISDNLPGILLAYLAATALVLAFVHPWRTVNPFRRLLYVSILGFVLFAILHNLFEAMAWNLGDPSLVRALLEGVGAALFLIATLVCPPALLIGVLGLVVISIRSRRRRKPGPTTTA